jgi:hypothetical protein
LWLARVFLWLLLVQGFHFLEHSVQLLQVFLLNDPNGGGLLGDLVNFELLHLGYNTLYLLGLLWLYAEVSLATHPAWSRHRLVALLLATAVAVQGYHEAEHILRVVQVLSSHSLAALTSTSTPEPPGFLGRWVNVVFLHWLLNGIVGALPMAAFAMGRFHRHLDRPERGSRRHFALAPK